MRTLTYNNAKKHFDEVLTQVQREDIEIQINGKSVAVVMSTENYQELERIKLELLKFKA